MSARVVRTFTWRVVFWREYGGNSGNGGKVGQKRANFFPALFVVTILHQFFRFGRQFPVLATSPRLSIATDSCRSAGGWEQGVVSGGLGSGQVGSEGAVFLVPDLCVCLRTRFLAVLIGFRADRLWTAYSLAAAFLRLQIACQRESGLTMMRSQQCLSAFRHSAIISLISMQLPWEMAGHFRPRGQRQGVVSQRHALSGGCIPKLG